jgi:hypothetical protein
MIQMIPGVRIAGKRQGKWALRALGLKKAALPARIIGGFCFDWGGKHNPRLQPWAIILQILF